MAKVCRACLATIDSHRIFHYLDDVLSGYTVRSMLLACIPETRVDIVQAPVLCSDCVQQLWVAYWFIHCFGQTQNDILDYMKATGVEELSQADFRDLVAAGMIRSPSIKPTEAMASPHEATEKLSGKVMRPEETLSEKVTRPDKTISEKVTRPDETLSEKVTRPDENSSSSPREQDPDAVCAALGECAYMLSNNPDYSIPEIEAGLQDVGKTNKLPMNEAPSTSEDNKPKQVGTFKVPRVKSRKRKVVKARRQTTNTDLIDQSNYWLWLASG